MIDSSLVTISFSEFDQSLYEKIIERMKKYSFCIIRGATDLESLKKSVESLKSNFEMKNDHPTTGESPEDIRDNFQKLLIGGVTKKYNNFPRFFRTFYNPLWSEDVYGLRDNFKRVAKVRNLLLQKPLDFALTGIEDNGLWTASRVHQYPTGGGFFEEHRDTTIMDVAEEKRVEFYQLILAMSEKGKDFDQGGAFVDYQGERLLIEDYIQFGDIAIYDGSTVHGVEEIDPHKNLVIDEVEGRLAGFVSLYKKM